LTGIGYLLVILHVMRLDLRIVWKLGEKKSSVCKDKSIGLIPDHPYNLKLERRKINQWQRTTMTEKVIHLP
jgi:hypothetical protein